MKTSADIAPFDVRFDVPVKFDDLGRYVALDQPAPFVWVRVDGDRDADTSAAEWSLLWRAMRAPERGVSRIEPFPRHLAESPEELAACMTGAHRTALLAVYTAWIEALGPTDLAELDDDYLDRLAREFHDEDDDLLAATKRVQYRFARDLQAAYGRPSLTLTQREVFEWMAWAGLYELPKPSSTHWQPQGKVVGRLTSYALKARRRL